MNAKSSLKKGAISGFQGRGLRVLHYSTWRTPCGIAGYAGSLVDHLEAQGLEQAVRPIDRIQLKAMTNDEVRRELGMLLDQARDYDLVHIQHEYSFFHGAGNTPMQSSLANWQWLLEELARMDKPTICTCHTDPFFIDPPVRDLPAPPPPPPPPRKPHPSLKQWMKEIVKWPIKKALLYPEPPEFVDEPVPPPEPPARDESDWRLDEIFSQRPDLFRLIVHSQRSRGAYLERGIPGDLVEVLPIGIDVDRAHLSHHTKEEAKAKLGIGPEKILLSLFGFVASYKGHEDALRALKILPEQYVLAVVGGPHPEGHELTLNRILKMWRGHDPNRLIVTGYVAPEELDLYHAATDICLAPYIDPNLSASAAISWAISSGKPVIASAIPAFREITNRVKCLLTVTPRAPWELAWQIEKLMNTPALQRQLAEGSRRYAELYSWQAIAAKTADLYGQLLQETAIPLPARRISVCERIAA